MNNESPSPDAQIVPPTPAAPVEPDSPALATDLEDSFFETKRLRQDGWDGPAMAMFCRTLAETGVVTEACRACGKAAKGAYALRQREPLFARAWESALTLARERLADDLLARSLKGSAEQIMRDGCIVGERHAYDNKLAFAILRRLDRRAELGATFRTPPANQIPCQVPAVSGDWQLLLDALSDDRKEDAALLLTPLPPEILPPEIVKSNEGNNPPVAGVEGDEMDQPYVPKRVWQEWQSDEWRTDFPPPPGFDGDENCNWEDEGYSRTLTIEEYGVLAGAGLAEPPPEDVTIEADEAERDAFFAALAAPVPPPALRATSRCEGEGLDRSAPPPVLGEVAAPADGGGMNPTKPPKSEPPSAPNRSTRGASKPGETP